MSHILNRIEHIVRREKSRLKHWAKEQEWSKDNTPYLVIISTGDNLASEKYIRGKLKDCEEVGFTAIHKHFTDEATNVLVAEYIVSQANDPLCRGIMLQLPLSKRLIYSEDELLNLIPPDKDVDGLAKDTKFTACTPLGVLTLLDDYDYQPYGKVFCVIGKGKTSGLPLIPLLLKEGATVISCNSKTPKKALGNYINNCDCLITATGVPNLITMDSFTNKYTMPDMIIDIGISQSDNGIVGDCEPKVHEVHRCTTPVPKGMGLLTRLSLLQNFKLACELGKGEEKRYRIVRDFKKRGSNVYVTGGRGNGYGIEVVYSRDTIAFVFDKIMKDTRASYPNREIEGHVSTDDSSDGGTIYVTIYES